MGKAYWYASNAACSGRETAGRRLLDWFSNVLFAARNEDWKSGPLEKLPLSPACRTRRGDDRRTLAKAGIRCSHGMMEPGWRRPGKAIDALFAARQDAQTGGWWKTESCSAVLRHGWKRIGRVAPNRTRCMVPRDRQRGRTARDRRWPGLAGSSQGWNADRVEVLDARAEDSRSDRKVGEGILGRQRRPDWYSTHDEYSIRCRVCG